MGVLDDMAARRQANAQAQREKTAAFEKKMYDETGGLRLVGKWPSAVRWLLFIPAAIVILIFVRVAGQPFVQASKDVYALTLGIAALVQVAMYAVAIDFGAAIAPRARVIVAGAIACVSLAGAVAMVLLVMRMPQMDMLATWVSAGAVVVGCALGFYSVQQRDKAAKARLAEPPLVEG